MSDLWHENSDEILDTTSTVTGRTVRYNLNSNQFYIPKNQDKKVFITASRQASEREKFNISTNEARIIKNFINNTDFQAITVNEHLSRILESYRNALTVADQTGRNSSGSSPHHSLVKKIENYLSVFWSYDCIMFPRSWGKPIRAGIGSKYVPGFYTGNNLADLLDVFKEISNKYHVQYLGRLMLRSGGIKESGDITFEGVQYLEPEAVDNKVFSTYGLAGSLVSVILKQHNIEFAPFSPSDFKRVRRTRFGGRTDTSLSIAKEKSSLDPEWIKYADKFISSNGRIAARTSSVLYFLEDLVTEHPFMTPEEYYSIKEGALDRPLGPECTKLTKWQKPTFFNHIAEFHIFVLHNWFSFENQYGQPQVRPEYASPRSFVKLKDTYFNRGKTDKPLFPARYVDLAKSLLTKNDFEIPKSIKGQWFYSRGENKFEKVWCPAAAFALLMMLETPLRSIQVRVLDSGEADDQRYDRQTGEWVANNGKLARQNSQSVGALRRIEDRVSQTEYVGLFVNTNKTGDLSKDPKDHGYEIEWENPEVIKILSDMRDWQEEHNPINQTMRWDEVEEFVTGPGAKSSNLLEGRIPAAFLFRWPDSKRSSEPVSYNSIRSVWKLLLLSLENHLTELGENPPSFFESKPPGSIQNWTTYYDLHGLRVSWITHMAEKGVPPSVLMHVAGHATVLMTLHYHNHSISHIQEILNAASVEVMRNAQDDYRRHLHQREYEDLTQQVSYFHSDGPRHLERNGERGSALLDIGICPMNCNGCDKGRLLNLGEHTERYAMVRGGSMNCLGDCRFFITGPAFLHGLRAKNNELTERYGELQKELSLTEKKLSILEMKRLENLRRGDTFTRMSELDIMTSKRDRLREQIDDVGQDWNNCVNRINQSLAILHQQRDSGLEATSKMALITQGSLNDIHLSYEMDNAGERHYELLDDICQNAVFFPSIDASKANLKRMRKLEAMGQRNGLKIEFHNMTDEDAMDISNEMGKFLFHTFRKPDVAALMEGQTTLTALGVDQEAAFKEIVDALNPHDAQMSLSKRPRIPNLRAIEAADD